MSFSPQIHDALRAACAKLGPDGGEVRELLEHCDVALALEVLLDAYDALGLPLAGPLQPYGLLAQLRSDLEELLERFAGDGLDARMSTVLGALAEVEAALDGAGIPETVGEHLLAWFCGAEASDEERVAQLLERVVRNAEALRPAP